MVEISVEDCYSHSGNNSLIVKDVYMPLFLLHIVLYLDTDQQYNTNTHIFLYLVNLMQSNIIILQ